MQVCRQTEEAKNIDCMMKFRTEYTPVPDPGLTLDPGTGVVLMGSCFTDNIGGMMRGCGWPVTVNPCGTLFNPLSIGELVMMAASEPDVRRERVERRLFEADGRWRSWDFPTRFSHPDRESCAALCMDALDTLGRGLREGSALIVTFGSAWIYRHEGEPVANCHKQPERIFSRSLASPDMLAEAWRGVRVALERLNPELRVIFTVSPVRHIRDGLEGNSLSKATLRLLAASLESEGACYFPAYEILTDDLRDYRFYADDLVHPSDMAVRYIWERFQEKYLTPAGRQVLREGERRMRREAHRSIL